MVISTRLVVMTSLARASTRRPKKPAKIAPISGSKTIAWYIGSRSAFQQVNFGDIDGAAITEVDDDDGEADGGLGRGDGEHDQRKDLPDQVIVERRKGDEIEVHRKQHQLDAHQNDDDVFAIEEDAENAKGEQDRGDGEVMGEADGHESPLPVSTSTTSTDRSRVRSTWRAIDWRLMSRLCWRVSTMAPIMATSRIIPAASNR